MNCNCGIYKFTNNINGKIYVGSSKNLKKRNRDHLNLNIKSGCSLFRKAIIKHGIDSFSFDILECVDNVNTLLEREQYYLNTLLSADLYLKGDSNYFIENGYNLSPIAKSREGVREIDTTHKFRKIIEYDKDGNFIKIWDSIKETSKFYNISSSRISKSCIKEEKGHYIFRYHEENYPIKITFKNRKETTFKMSDENKKKISEYMKTQSPRHVSSVSQFDTNDVLINTFISIKEAERQTKISNTSISNVVNGISKTAGGYKWVKNN